MNIVPIQYSVFDDEAVRAMGAAFDQACHSFRHFAHLDRVRELVARASLKLPKRRARSDSPSLAGSSRWFRFDDVPIAVDSVGRNLPVPVYAPISATEGDRRELQQPSDGRYEGDGAFDENHVRPLTAALHRLHSAWHAPAVTKGRSVAPRSQTRSEAFPLG